MKTPARVLICYDRDDDDTLPAIKNNPAAVEGMTVVFVRNRARGAHAAVMAGFAASEAPFVLVFPADDDFNAGMLDAMVAKASAGADIVCASRFIPGGSMVGCPWLKAVLVRARRSRSIILPGCRRMTPATASACSRGALIRNVVIESDQGFCYSIELLVKCHRLGWPVAEVPARWFERKAGPEPVPRSELAAGLSALVRLRLRHHLFAPAGK